MKEIRFAGTGGQGILLAGNILAEAIAVYEGRNVARNTAYGGQVRGGASRCEVLIAENNEEIDFPQVLCADILVAMSPEAVDVFVNEVKPEGLILLDTTMVPNKPDVSCRVVGIKATEIADNTLGQIQTANMVVLGALVALTDMVSIESIEKTLKEKVPPKTIDTNLEAFRLGMKAVNR